MPFSVKDRRRTVFDDMRRKHRLFITDRDVYKRNSMPDFDLLEENYHALDNPACMLVPVKPIEGLEGDYIFHNSHTVTEINRHKSSDIYCSGIQILNPAKVNQLTTEGEDFYSVWQQLILQKQLKSSSVYPKKWFTVDTIAQLASLSQIIF